MKKIFIFSVTAILAIIAFNSCENDEINTIEIKPTPKVFPEPCTAWGCTVDSVKKHMSNYQLEYFDVDEKDVIMSDGTIVPKWIAVYEGENPYSKGKIIDYDYCFDESNNGLRALIIDLGIESHYQLSDIETQLMANGYNQTGYDVKTGQFYYSNNKSQVKIYNIRGKGQSETHRKLKFWKLADDEITWGEN